MIPDHPAVPRPETPDRPSTRPADRRGRPGREGRTHDRRPEAVRQQTSGTGRAIAGRSSRRPGLRLLVPGWPQFAWGQAERGWVLLGSFVVAAGAGVLAWGTWLSWCFFAFAFLAHVSSTTDALRQGSFPVYPRRTAVPMIAGLAGGPPLPAGAPDPGRHRLAGLRAGPDAERLPGQLLGLSQRRPAARTLGLAPPAALGPAPCGPGRRRRRPGSRVDRP